MRERGRGAPGSEPRPDEGASTPPAPHRRPRRPETRHAARRKWFAIMATVSTEKFSDPGCRAPAIHCICCIA
eukprot:3116971-Prymnesium_polylepis.1